MLIRGGCTSTIDQEAGLEAQERDLKAIGVGKLFVWLVILDGRACPARSRSGLL